MGKKLIWKGRTALFTAVYLREIGLDVERIKVEEYFEIESGNHKGVYRLHHVMKPEGDLYCKLFEPEN